MSTLADILLELGPGFLARNSASPAQRLALRAIQRCRTPELGGHVYVCTRCKHSDYSYHSCHNRACPRCGGARTKEWTQKQTDRLLPVEYFLVTFTLPSPVAALALCSPSVLYELLFSQSSRALQTVASRSNLLGAELGFLGVLHTWNRQLGLHPHVHYIIPGGGLRSDHKKWRRSRQPDWFLPVHALSAAFRQGMEAALRASSPALHASIPQSCWRGAWVVHSQAAGSGEAVLRYLSRYVFRTAICDERIVDWNKDHVRFKYTDRKSGELRTLSLESDEFIRRYLLHVPPSGFHRVRYFGWMHPSAKRRRILVETLLNAVILIRPRQDLTPAWHLCCPECKEFTLILVARLPRGPPACCSR